MSFRFAWTGLPIGGVFCYTTWYSDWRPNWFRNWHLNNYSESPSFGFSIEQQYIRIPPPPPVELYVPVMKVSCTGKKGEWKKFMDENSNAMAAANVFLLFLCPPLFVILFMIEIALYNDVDIYL